jgi:hypothetical protein
MIERDEMSKSRDRLVQLTAVYQQAAVSQTRLEDFQVDALLGKPFDTEAYDLVILECRAARREATAALLNYCSVTAR